MNAGPASAARHFSSHEPRTRRDRLAIPCTSRIAARTPRVEARYARYRRRFVSATRAGHSDGEATRRERWARFAGLVVTFTRSAPAGRASRCKAALRRRDDASPLRSRARAPSPSTGHRRGAPRRAASSLIGACAYRGTGSEPRTSISAEASAPPCSVFTSTSSTCRRRARDRDGADGDDDDICDARACPAASATIQCSACGSLFSVARPVASVWLHRHRERDHRGSRTARTLALASASLSPSAPVTTTSSTPSRSPTSSGSGAAVSSTDDGRDRPGHVAT